MVFDEETVARWKREIAELDSDPAFIKLMQEIKDKLIAKGYYGGKKVDAVSNLSQAADFPLEAVTAWKDSFSTTEPPSVSNLASLVNSVSADFHYIHFLAKSNGGNWDRIHEVAGGYYAALGDDYDSLAELAIQLGEDIIHPNNTATASGFNNSEAVDDGFGYVEAMNIIKRELNDLVQYASSVLESYQDTDPASTSARNFIEDFIMRWSKEANYKTSRRLS